MNDQKSEPGQNDKTEAVAGILIVENRFLMIERSQKVISPGKICFPGGKIHPPETYEEAVAREFQEELNLKVQGKEKVWECVTSWNCKVHWLIVECVPNHDLALSQLRPDVEEVADVFWRSPNELLEERELLESNRYFLEEVEAGEINLSGI